MSEAFICDAIRTPVGRLGGSLASIRADDLAAFPLRELMRRNPSVDWSQVDDVVLGCANQSGEDNRNLARMATLLAGLPESVPGITVNRLCASGLSALGMAAQAIRAGDAELIVAGGAESMTRAPYVMGKAESGFSRAQKIEDTTLGWRFINPAMKAQYGADSMPQTAENVAEQWQITREDQDAFALASQEKAAQAQRSGRFAKEIAPVTIPQRRGDPMVFTNDEHLRATSAEKLAALKPVVHEGGSITAGNASGLNDGAAAMIVSSESAIKANALTPRARILSIAASGIAPRIMGLGPVEAARKALRLAGLDMRQMDVLELNEAFAAQAIAVLRQLDVEPDDPRVNPNGGAIALGHPLGMSGARIAMSAVEELQLTGGRYALAFLCVGVGQGVAMVMEKI